MGFKDLILSPELNFAQIRDMGKTANCGIFAYGKLRLMVVENDMMAHGSHLKDRTGARFFVCGDFGRRNIIHNSVPTYLADKKEMYRNIGLFFVSLCFTDEPPEQIKKIISDYAQSKDGIKPPEKFTRGYK
jgi:hypothetical protein